MRLINLHLENFRVYEDAALSFGDSSFVVIFGPNFAGKSSLGQALSMCLTPTTTGLTPAGWGYLSKIKRGASKAVITADFQTKRHLMQRIVTLSNGPSGRTQKSVCLSDPSWNASKFDEQLEKQKSALTVVLNTDAFLVMDEKEQKNLLAGLALPRRYEFSPMIIAEVETIFGQGTINFAGEPFAAINQAYKKLFDERQIVNRQVRDFLIPEALPVPEMDSSLLQEQMATLRVKRREQQQARDQAVAEASRKESTRTRAKAVLQDAIESGSRQERAIREKLLKDGQLEYLRKVAAGEEALRTLISERQQMLTMRDQYAVQLKNLENVPWNSKQCPTCEQPVDPQALKTLAARLKEALREADGLLAKIAQKMTALGDVEQAIALIEKHEQALKELDAFGERADERQEQIEKAQREIPDPTLFDFAPYNESLAELDTEIDRLSGLLRPVIVAEERLKEIEIKRVQLGDLKEKAMVLDQLVKYFDKDGIKAKLIGEYIGGFEHKLNEVMSGWGYSCALSIEPYSFDVTNARGDTNPVRELSGAERVMFSLAFQVAVSRTANLGMVVIDEVAMFLPELRPVLHERLYDMVDAGYLEQVILLVADTSEPVPDRPGTVVYMVDNGTVHLSKNTFHKEEVHEHERSIA